MTSLATIEALPDGAHFFRVDLHIHSYGGSHDVLDPSMTPAAIVTTCLAEGVQLIALTDHNDISNVEAAIAAAAGSALRVIPAVELSTPQGHLLCFLPSPEILQQFYGRLSVADRGLDTSRCQTSLLDVLGLLAERDGFGILAHVDGEGGFETANPGASPHKVDVLCHKALTAIEVLQATSLVTYSRTDPDPARAECGRVRFERLANTAGQHIARVLGSDAHKLQDLGHNALGARRLTRIKMDQPHFGALRIALQDGDARVRLEDEIPAAVPLVLGVAFGGGFLDDQKIRFSSNLNCIIGGRGTGKSTIFEAVRCLDEQPSANTIVDSDVWPDDLTLVWQDQAGGRHVLRRQRGDSITNASDPTNGPTHFPLETYAQGETAHISKAAHEDPLALLSYLDRFVDVEEALEDEATACSELLALQAEIDKARKNVELIPQKEQALSMTEKQLVALELAKAKEVIELQRRLATEHEMRNQVTKAISDLEDALSDASVMTCLDGLIAIADPAALTVGSAEFGAIVGEARSFKSGVVASRAATKDALSSFKSATDSQLSSWKGKEAGALQLVETKRRTLEAQGVRLDMGFIQKLSADEAKLKADLVALRTWKPHLDQLVVKRTTVSKRRWDARDRVGMIREAYGKAASETLKTALIDFRVTLKFQRSAYSPDGERQITEAMGWRTSQVPRAALLIERLTLPGLLKALDKKDLGTILGVATKDGSKVFDKSEAGRVIETLSASAVRWGLERCAVFDIPRLTVTRSSKRPDGSSQFVNKDFARLSLGQQQSVLLALVLSSRSSAPLIIDQPEDNLDGEFIFNSLVPVLRRAKERRQVIVVTHNANIAVLGDAEQILVLKSTAEKGVVASRGSIDEPGTRDFACAILEGAREAFERRGRIYGIKL